MQQVFIVQSPDIVFFREPLVVDDITSTLSNSKKASCIIEITCLHCVACKIVHHHYQETTHVPVDVSISAGTLALALAVLFLRQLD